jgi:hypothetical protein
MSVSLTMMFGRLGAIFGNLLFPWILSIFGCLPAFMMFGGFALGNLDFMSFNFDRKECELTKFNMSFQFAVLFV